MFKIPQKPTLTSEEIDEYLRGFEVEVFEETKEEKAGTGEDTDAELAELVKKLPDRKTLEGLEMSLVEFEKDDDTNFHVAYVTACSNLRATNYAIPEADFQKTKMIAGKIIPAMISTTALVSGLQCLELIKAIQVEDKTIDSFRSSFANIALPLFVFQSPLPCEEKEICPGVKTSIWTSFNHNAPKDETVGQFIDAMRKKFGVKVESIIYEAVMLFADFLLKGKDLEDRLKMTMKQAYSFVAKKEIPADKECIELCLDCVTAEDEQEIEEFPSIVYFFA
jgi:ubiquitin-activating enzyme E1